MEKPKTFDRQKWAGELLAETAIQFCTATREDHIIKEDLKRLHKRLEQSRKRKGEALAKMMELTSPQQQG